MGRQPLSASPFRKLTLHYLRGAWAGFRRLFEHDDPLVASSNLVALVVLWNQPFYPLYVWLGVSDVIWPSLFTFLSTPFFLAVPLLARFRPLASRVLLPLVGTANTLVCAKVFGVASGVEVFLIPCALIPCVFFHPSERWISLALIALPFLAYLGLHGSYGEPVHVYSPEEYSAFLTMNALSAAMLTVFVGLLARSTPHTDGEP